MNDPLSVAGLFAGIAGIELGLAEAGHRGLLLCEIDPAAQVVLRTQLPGVHLHGDVRTLEGLPEVDLVAAGFPCTDLSQAGRKQGIGGQHSGLVDQVFRLLDSGHRPRHVLLENVSYMLRLDRGAAMNFLVSEFESRGYTWAYRVVDARSFGVPQRRQRVMMLASLADDPRSVLFADEATTPGFDDTIGVPDPEAVYGFYWTEGLRGLGWAKNSVPTIKGGSGLGIPSPPAVWIPATGEVGTPQLEDAERMQGFPVDWTYPAVDAGFRLGERWKMVGNAVCVNMSEWVGSRLLSPGQTTCASSPLESGSRWPMAAWGRQGERYAVDASMYPIDSRPNLSKFLTMPLRPLSAKATAGFLSRARRGNLRFADGFLAALDSHLHSMK